MKIGIIQQHNTTDVDNNKHRLAEKIKQLAEQGAQLVVLQELHNSLYFCQEENVDLFNLAEPIPGPSTQFFGALARELGIVIVTSLFERRAAGLYHNTAVVMERDGSIAGKYRKMHIPDDPAYYEKFYFTPGDLGFHPIDTSVGRLGVLVCWDQWYPEAARLMALQGADLLIYPTAIGYESSDPADEQQRQREAWTTVQRGHAVANGLPVITVNRVGLERLQQLQGQDTSAEPDENTTAETDAKQGAFSHIQFWGNSFVAGPQGELLYRASETEEEQAVVNVDMERSENVRRWWPFLRDRRIDAYADITRRFID
ncbi:MAG: carbon-nitrogen hydrolase [Prevotella sp.]|nr:carbon-nitrogen hydrolase [Prevotella sp.]